MTKPIRYPELKRREMMTEGIVISADAMFENYKMDEGYYKEMADMGRTLAKAGREQAIETVKMAVQNAYFNLLFGY